MSYGVHFLDFTQLNKHRFSDSEPVEKLTAHCLNIKLCGNAHLRLDVRRR